MAIGDILQGLLAGAAGGVRGYSAYQQEEAARREREEEREAARLEREEERNYRRSLDQALRDFTMSEAGYRVAPEMAVEGATIAPTAPELARVLEEPEFGIDIPAPRRPETRDGRMEGGAMVAPGQTYSAIQQALMEAERPEAAPPRSRVVMERGEAPEPVRLPSAAERGASVLRFPDDRTYVRERQLTEAEKAEMDLQRDIERARAMAGVESDIEIARAEEIAAAQARAEIEANRIKAQELGLQPGTQAYEDVITSGRITRFQPRVTDESDPLQKKLDDWADDVALFARTPDMLGNPRSRAEIDSYAITVARARRIPDEYLREFVTPRPPNK